MTIYAFGVTPVTVRGECFPAIGAFTTNSNPTAAVVTSIINQKAAELGGLLASEGVSAATVHGLGAEQIPYLWCQETLTLMVAVRLLQIITSNNPKLAEAWANTLSARLKDLADRGAIALGDASLDTGTSPANGPTTHITHFSLSLPSNDDLSSLDPPFRKDDLL